MLHHCTRLFKALIHRRWTMGFKRVAGANKPPDLIQTKAFERFTRDMRMASVGRIKRTAQQPDNLTGCRIWNIMAQRKMAPEVSQGPKGGEAPPFVNQRPLSNLAISPVLRRPK